MNDKRIIVGISGASGFQYGVKVLELLRKTPSIEIHLVVSKGAQSTRELETDYSEGYVASLAHVVHKPDNLAATISSGSFQTFGMIVAPCSMKTLSAIAHGYTENLMIRAADVTLKERRPLVLMTRETPLNLSHIRNMELVTQMGGIIFPPTPAMYQKPKTVDEILLHSASRALNLLGVAHAGAVPGWAGASKKEN